MDYASVRAPGTHEGEFWPRRQSQRDTKGRCRIRSWVEGQESDRSAHLPRIDWSRSQGGGPMKDRLVRHRWGWGRLVAAVAVAVPLVPVGARPALARPCQQGSACMLSWRNCRASGITNTMQDGTLRADLHVD